MRSLAICGAMLVVATMVAIPLVAQEKGKKKGGMQQPQQITAIVKKAEDANLTDDQKKKLKELADAATAKIVDLRKGLPQEVQKQLAEARKKVADEGKKGKEAKEAVEAMVKLTDEQKTTLTDIEKAVAKFQQDVSDMLTAEQRDKAGFKGKKKR